MAKPVSRRVWTSTEIAYMHATYADTPTAKIARTLGRPASQVYAKAADLELRKSEAYLASPDACRLRRGDNVGAAYRFQKGHVPANKGLRRPGWGTDSMRRNWFKPGAFPAWKDPEFYVLGALRVNTDGYIDMRISFAHGALGWRALHRILWEDAHGPVPPGHVVCFKNRDPLDCELANLELVSRADLARRNSIHNLPQPLRSTINVLGQLKRRIREKQDRGSAQSPVRNARGPARR